MEGIRTYLVPIAAWHGKGSHQEVFGVFLMAVFNEASGSFQTVCKLGTGLSDTQLKEQMEALRKSHLVPRCPENYQIHPSMTPDVWIRPSFVWEVLAADLNLSIVHTAAQGQVHDTKGITLRFPRFVKVCEEKTPQHATSSQEILEMYKTQQQAASQYTT